MPTASSAGSSGPSGCAFGTRTETESFCEAQVHYKVIWSSAVVDGKKLSRRS